MKKEIENEKAIMQSNKVSTALHNYTEVEIDVMYVIIAKLKATTTSKDKIVISTAHVQEMTGKVINAGKLQKAVIKGLATKGFQIETIIEKGRMKGQIRHINRPIFGNIEWIDGGNSFHCYINEWSIPLFLDLKDNFTIVSLANIFSLVGKYSKRFYVLLSSWKNIYSKKPITIIELYKILMLDNSYEEWGSFHQRVLRPAIKEINQKTDIRVSYKANKHLRTTVSINFFYEKLDMADRQLEFEFSEQDERDFDESDDNIIDISYEEVSTKKLVSEKDLKKLFDNIVKPLKDNKDYLNMLLSQYEFDNIEQLSTSIKNFMMTWLYQNENKPWKDNTHFWNAYKIHRTKHELPKEAVEKDKKNNESIEFSNYTYNEPDEE